MPAAARQHKPTRVQKHPDPLRLRLEKGLDRLFAIAERLICELDALETDPDLEPYPAARETYGHGPSFDQTAWAAGGDCDEREEEDEHGGDINDEPHDREPHQEHTLGAPDLRVDQTNWMCMCSDLHDDGEDDHPREETSLETFGRFLRSGGDDSEDCGDTEFDPGEWGIADEDAREDEESGIIWPDPATRERRDQWRATVVRTRP